VQKRKEVLKLHVEKYGVAWFTTVGRIGTGTYHAGKKKVLPPGFVSEI